MKTYYVAGIPYSSELYHHGIKGQQWGIRRFQNDDGSLTAAGRDRYLEGDQNGSSQKKNSSQSSITRESIQKAADRKVSEAIAKRDQSFFGQGGTVDLNRRPVIPSDWLNEMGYDVPKGGTATVFSHSISIGDHGEHAVSLTPILPDGDVLEKSTLDEVMKNIYLGDDGKPHLDGDWGFELEDILLSHYDVSDIPENLRSDYINAMSNGLHEVQEALYDGVEPITAPTNDIPSIDTGKSEETTKKGKSFVDTMKSTLSTAVSAVGKAANNVLDFVKKLFK